MVKAILQLRAKMQDIRSDAADADADGDSRDSGLLGMKPHDLPDEPCNRSRAEQTFSRQNFTVLLQSAWDLPSRGPLSRCAERRQGVPSFWPSPQLDAVVSPAQETFLTWACLSLPPQATKSRAFNASFSRGKAEGRQGVKKVGPGQNEVLLLIRAKHGCSGSALLMAATDSLAGVTL
ncbi:hypothetical protein AXG93_698s1100 [Marchantia polymorpha subsp. ruderalis]|uniref:Uncharacterized protein n=1 Tax=Marchantia polymorpha subsp. ruderalis TaxID=1480154 RepID=A0A176VGD3_MARPO|nr:hypothetical protein AXG93_698s1100 [Marchantia polymorpha subsp. ruderalis]